MNLLARHVQWYTCGPTVYDVSHLGHARTYVTIDIMQRLMARYFGMDVKHAMNITDIDDKIILRSAEAGLLAKDLAERCETAFFADMAALGCKAPDVVLRVTEHMADIIDYISRIEQNGYAVQRDDGLYFDLDRYVQDGHAYGTFRPVTGHPCTGFALWKLAKDSEPHWASPWGDGRPGWHIECTALATRACGDFINFHAGGEDLCFPHHENEIAQAVAAGTSLPWVEQWVHIGHLSIAGHKMSKSLKNFISIKDALRDHTPRQLRLAFALHPWRQAMSWGGRMGEVVSKERSIISFLDRARAVPTLDFNGMADVDLGAALGDAKARVHESLERDLDTSSALGHVFELISKANAWLHSWQGTTGSSTLAAVAAFVEGIFWAMGIDFREAHSAGFQDFHKAVRDQACSVRKKYPELSAKLYELCDAARSVM